jgi:hypothetical protein
LATAFISDLLDHVDRERRSERLVTVLQHGPEVAALDQPHVQVEQAIDLPVAVDRHHMRVVEPGRGLRFAPEPLLEGGVLGEMEWKHLERDNPVGFGVVGPVDLAHTAPADQLLQLIVPEWCRIHRLLLSSGCPRCVVEATSRLPAMSRRTVNITGPNPTRSAAGVRPR